MDTVKDTVNSLLGRKPNGPKVRYGVVAAGWITQAAFIPGVGQTSNSTITVIVSDDAEKREKLGKEYNLKSYTYDQFSQALEEGHCDAFYIATPNNQHRKFAVPALEKGYHVLLEKPMEVSVEDCEAILAAQKKSGAKLMIAYRLHHEPGTLDVIDRVRKGDFGDPRIFSSVFTQSLKAENHRAKQGYDAGPVPDMGAYPINAVRNIFGLEPIEVTAVGFKTPGCEYLKMEHDTINATLRFPGDRVAQFTVSYATAATEGYKVVGTKGEIEVNPSYGFGSGVKIAYKTKIDGKEDSKTFPETDHFGGETEYFSECILNNTDPEADGEDGLNDVRVIAAIKESLAGHGKTIKLDAKQRQKRPVLDQAKKLSLGKEPKVLIGRDSQKPGAS
ncbi:unnamed protein product [Adineta steineri]|uniref:Glucose-fructose oxidoreductase n=1 Tax=Adineta steineri TaxID=433720 RepID=A0A819GXK3_9BILA|nr:unnamed protein product [Adineta steineri]CAF1526609.1 unnamed protein product [Adineta steineri]CAF3507466.1 unnamed protein product [Adineta steineri]CAF3888406.1 unnamed protein product [Adineta steineri]